MSDPDCAMCRAAPALSAAFALPPPDPAAECRHWRGGGVNDPPLHEPTRFIPVTLESLRDSSGIRYPVRPPDDPPSAPLGEF